MMPLHRTLAALKQGLAAVGRRLRAPAGAYNADTRAAPPRNGFPEPAALAHTPQTDLPEATPPAPTDKGADTRPALESTIELTPFAPKLEPDEPFAPRQAVPVPEAAPLSPAIPDPEAPPDWLALIPEDASPPDAAHVLVLFGAGHVAREVAKVAAYAGFVVDVLDTRADYATAERFPVARRLVHCADYARFAEQYPVDSRHYAVVLTHSYETDLTLLRALLGTPARYLGVMGDGRKKENLFAELRAAGCPAAELACVCCPVGVPVGAETPAEVAVAVVAELVAARAGVLRPDRRPQRLR